MANRLLESGDNLLIEDGSSFRLLEEVVATIGGLIARGRDTAVAVGIDPGIARGRDPWPV